MNENNTYRTLFEFASGVAQELKHPLGAVMNRTRALVDKYRKKDFEYIGYRDFQDLLKALDGIHTQMKYCYDTTSRLVDLNKRKIGMRRKSCQANAVIREVLRTKRHQLNLNGVRCKLRLKQPIPAASISPIDLTHVIGNLVENAIQAMPAGGQLNIKTSYTKGEERIRIEIRDNGIGIPKEDLPHIFEPFFTTKARGVDKNSGLGLAIAYSLTRTAQGKIRVESSQRRGTAVTLELGIARKPVRRK